MAVKNSIPVCVCVLPSPYVTGHGGPWSIHPKQHNDQRSCQQPEFEARMNTSVSHAVQHLALRLVHCMHKQTNTASAYAHGTYLSRAAS